MTAAKPSVSITFCTQCNWLLRAGWMAQELLSSFGEDLASVTLVPGYGGIYRIEVDGKVLWDRKADGGFPDAREVKTRLRDHCWPERELGHLDRKGATDA
ncbi:SelT/SelW/SelH family protein [Thioclava sp. FR2]|uniref:SelT/SelW/SelH family protein n=1 Tax=Thioclava sp. FR2 TaxID=3445780 RepID=UPI003EB970F2